MWSQPVKERLLDHIPQMIIFDSLGSSEAIGMGKRAAHAIDRALRAGERLPEADGAGERVDVLGVEFGQHLLGEELHGASAAGPGIQRGERGPSP